VAPLEVCRVCRLSQQATCPSRRRCFEPREAYSRRSTKTTQNISDTRGIVRGKAATLLESAAGHAQACLGIAFNARGLFDRLETELARSRRYHEPLALLSVDLDGLKAINDRYGHRAGDDAIRSVADVIRSELRESDLGARWGGDEFAVLAPSTSRVAAVALAERIRVLIARRRTRWPLSVSVGVATVDPKTDAEGSFESATLMRAADAAMYEAKRQWQGSGHRRVASHEQQRP
jgi:diguanylate cyclase (GGDEF)-like protein